MNQKQQNLAIADQVIKSEYWKEEYSQYFSKDLTIIFSSAPPGMPQYMDTYDSELLFMWLRRTVKSWQVDFEELLGTPDENLIWVTGYYYGTVDWGARENDFKSKFIYKLSFHEGKISCMDVIMDPLAFIAAAGREIPIFKMDMYDPKVDAFLAYSKGETAEPAQTEPDMSPEAIEVRMKNNLNAFRNGDYFKSLEEMATYSPDYESKVWFLPPEMKAEYPDNLLPRVHAWTELSCPWIIFDQRGKVYATDDPSIWFCEYMCYGETDWVGNNCRGMYRNRYFYRIEFDEAGRMKKCEEFLNPINKYNSVNISLPSFPYWI